MQIQIKIKNTVSDMISLVVKYVNEGVTGVTRVDRNGDDHNGPLSDFVYGSKQVLSGWWRGYSELSSGIYNNDALSGPGKRLVVHDNGYTVRSRGVFNDDLINGKGEMEVSYPYPINGLASGVVLYKGVFKDDVLHGKGVISSPFFVLDGVFNHGRLQSGSIKIHKYVYGSMSSSYRGIRMMRGTFSQNYKPIDSTCVLPFIGLSEGTIDYTKSMYKVQRTTGTYINGTTLHGERCLIRYTNGNTLMGALDMGWLCGRCLFRKPSGEYMKGAFRYNDVSPGGVHETRMSNGTIVTNTHNDTDFECKTTVSFTNGDVFECTYPIQQRRKRLPLSRVGLCVTGNTADDFLEKIIGRVESNLSGLLDKQLTECEYTVSENIKNMGVTEFRFWLYTRDRVMFDLIEQSNLSQYLDGEMYDSFTEPADFHLPDVNDNVLRKLLDLKQSETGMSSNTGIVYISAKIIGEKNGVIA